MPSGTGCKKPSSDKTKQTVFVTHSVTSGLPPTDHASPRPGTVAKSYPGRRETDQCQVHEVRRRVLDMINETEAPSRFGAKSHNKIGGFSEGSANTESRKKYIHKGIYGRAGHRSAFDMGNLTQDFPVNSPSSSKTRYATPRGRLYRHQPQLEGGRRQLSLEYGPSPPSSARTSSIGAGPTVSLRACALPSGRRQWRVQSGRKSLWDNPPSPRRRRSLSNAASTRYRPPHGSSKSRPWKRRPAQRPILFCAERFAEGGTEAGGNRVFIASSHQ